MLVAVGGHSRSVGKTSVVCGIIAAIPEARWQAIKITQHGHNVCSEHGHPCNCAPADPSHPYALDAQVEMDGTDSGRYLAAGAERSYWLRTARGELGHAVPKLRELLGQAENTIVESNSVLRFFQPSIYVSVLDFSNADIKESARFYMDRADAYVVVNPGLVPWPGIPSRWFREKPCFAAAPPVYVSEELVDFVRTRLTAVHDLSDAHQPRRSGRR
jgi:hypothetical protein